MARIHEVVRDLGREGSQVTGMDVVRALPQIDRFKVTGTCKWTDSERRVLPGEHGTTSQYSRALRAGATPCDKCKAANTARDMAWRRAHPDKKSGTGKKVATVTSMLGKEAKKAGTPGARQAGTGTVKGRKVG